MAESNSEIPLDAPHQPRSFDFPKKKYGQNSVRSFQAKWFDRWPWLHYSKAKDLAFGFTCLKAHKEGKLVWSVNADAAFITLGFSYWKNAMRKFDAIKKASVILKLF